MTPLKTDLPFIPSLRRRGTHQNPQKGLLGVAVFPRLPKGRAREGFYRRPKDPNHESVHNVPSSN